MKWRHGSRIKQQIRIGHIRNRTTALPGLADLTS